MKNFIKKNNAIIVFGIGLILLVIGLYLTFNKKTLIIPENLEIVCNSYYLSKENNSIECNVLSFPKESNNEIIWEADSDEITIIDNLVSLNSLDIIDSHDVTLKAISKHDNNVYTETKIKLISNNTSIEIIPTCSITANKNQIYKDESFSINVNCSSNKNLEFNNKELIFNNKYLKLTSVKSNNNENNLSFEYTFKTLKEGNISITIPQDYALSNENGNYMNSLTVSIINNNKDNNTNNDDNIIDNNNNNNNNNTDNNNNNTDNNNNNNNTDNNNNNNNNNNTDNNNNNNNDNNNNDNNIKDNIGPIISYNLKGGTYSENKTININVTDNESGVKEFSINVYKNGIKDESLSISKITNKTSHSISLSSDGVWRIETSAFDNAGNKNQGDSLTSAGWYYQTYTISTPNSLSCSFKNLDKQYIKVNETATYTLTCIDNNGFKDSDVNNSDFIINTTGIVNIERITKNSITNGFTYLINVKGLKDGKTTISLKNDSIITNNNKKNNITTSSTITVDSTSPVITYSLKGGTYYTTKTVTINVSDATSGIKEFGINVYKNGVKDETRSTSKITNKTSHSINLGGDGTWRIETYAFDNAGNKNKGDSLTNAGWYYQTYTINTTKNNNYIHFIKLGASTAGDAILLQSNGQFALIDTGYNTTTTQVINYLNAVGVKKLEFLLITHFDGDHMGGAKEILKNFATDTLYIKTLNPNFNNSASAISIFNQIVSISNSKSTKVVYTETLGSTYSLTMQKMKIKLYNLNTYNNIYRNAESIIAYIKIDNTKTVLTADAISPYNNDVLNSIASEAGYNIDVYKMPHHGCDGCAIIKSFIPSHVVVTNYSKGGEVRDVCINQYTSAKYYYTEDNPYSLVVEYDKDSVRLFRNKIGT